MAMITHHLDRCVGRWGGKHSDYEDISNFLDITKVYVSDWRHRVLFHNTLGIELIEYLFPKITYVKNPTSVDAISTRTIAEMHILEDLGCVPTAKWMLKGLTPVDFYFPTNLSNWFNDKQIELILIFYRHAPNRVRVYYSTLLLDLLVGFYGVEDYATYVEGIKALTAKSSICTPGDYLVNLPIANWMGKMNAQQIKTLRKTEGFI